MPKLLVPSKEDSQPLISALEPMDVDSTNPTKILWDEAVNKEEWTEVPWTSAPEQKPDVPVGKELCKPIGEDVVEEHGRCPIGVVVHVEYVNLGGRLYPREFGYYAPSLGTADVVQIETGWRITQMTDRQKNKHKKNRDTRNGLTLIPRHKAPIPLTQFPVVLRQLYEHFCPTNQLIAHSRNEFWLDFPWGNMRHVQILGTPPPYFITDPCKEHMSVTSNVVHCARSCAVALYKVIIGTQLPI